MAQLIKTISNEDLKLNYTEIIDNNTSDIIGYVHSNDCVSVIAALNGQSTNNSQFTFDTVRTYSVNVYDRTCNVGSIFQVVHEDIIVHTIGKSNASKIKGALIMYHSPIEFLQVGS